MGVIGIKILVVHNLHRTGSASGDDQVFRNETRLLKELGHTVVEYSVINDTFDNKNIFGKLKDMFSMFWSFKNYNAVRKIIREEQPDVMHVHTFFPLLSPSVFYAAKRCNCKVVQTVHDTRFVCPAATSLRQGQLCDLCCDGRFFRMARYGCFKRSRSQSAVVALIFKVHRFLETFYKKIDAYICLNDDQIRLLKKAGFDDRKLFKKYNFTRKPDIGEIPDNISQVLPERFVAFYGRIGEEKGIDFLCSAWERLPDIPLVIMGDGPMKQKLIDWSADKKNIFFLGYVKHDQCASIVTRSEFVVFPSIWYEGCSMVVIETESLGKPLIATDLGFSGEAVMDGYNGYKFKLGDMDGFCKEVSLLWGDKILVDKLSKNAETDYQMKYTPEGSAKQLLEIYHKVLNTTV